MKTHNRKKWVLKTGLLTFIMIGIAILSVITTTALFTDRAEARNFFKMGYPKVEVEEDISGLKKEKIGVSNKGTIPCFVRMMVTLPQLEGVEVQTKPETIQNWTRNEDGYWYYNEPVSPGEQVILYDSVEIAFTDQNLEEGELPDGISLDQMQIIAYAESVQSSHIIAGTRPEKFKTDAEYAFSLLK